MADGVWEKPHIFSRFGNKYYYLFAKSGFSSEVKKAARNNSSIRLFTLSDLYQCSGSPV